MKGFIALLTLFSMASLAAEDNNTYQISAGLGHQYGGVLGAQVAYQEQDSKFYASLGLVGIAAGFEKAFTDNNQHSIGLVAGIEEIKSEDGFAFVTYNYHVNGFDKDGFVIGAGIGITREDEAGFFGDSGETETSTSFTINLGYKF